MTREEPAARNRKNVPERCPVTVLWDDRFLEYEFGHGHPFTEKSRKLAVDLLECHGFFERPSHRREGSFEPATHEVLKRFHEEEYLDRVGRASSSPRHTILDTGDTPSFPGCFEASARIAAGTLRGIELLRDAPETHLFQPGGGLHHAHPDAASGFCIFNDVALAISTALKVGGFKRVAYLDIDVHHGDGVMYGFYRDGRVLDIDFHQDGRTLFPGTGSLSEVGQGDGAQLKVNVPLPPGAGDREFLGAFHRVVPPMLREYKPELIVLQTGVDGHVGDPLARLQYTSVAYQGALEEVHELAHELCHGRLLETGGGGYTPENVARVLAQSGLLLAGEPAPDPAEPLPPTWREKFAEVTGGPAPSRWGSGPTPIFVAHVAPVMEDTLRQLGHALGREFPAT
jgi:acetoin utilization protein AcuC